MTLSLGLPGIRRDPGVPPSTDGRPDVSVLIDRFGREAHDLRVSITEKCSLRCTYCMPSEGLPAIARDQLLTAQEIARLVGIAVRDLGVRDIRFTGGEPLMRADLEEIVGLSAGEISTSSITGVSLSMTTNGIGLDKRVDGLVAAGLNRINISLDTVDRDHFTFAVGGQDLGRAWHQHRQERLMVRQDAEVTLDGPDDDRQGIAFPDDALSRYDLDAQNRHVSLPSGSGPSWPAPCPCHPR